MHTHLICSCVKRLTNMHWHTIQTQTQFFHTVTYTQIPKNLMNWTLKSLTDISTPTYSYIHTHWHISYSMSNTLCPPEYFQAFWGLRSCLMPNALLSKPNLLIPGASLRSLRNKASTLPPPAHLTPPPRELHRHSWALPGICASIDPSSPPHPSIRQRQKQLEHLWSLLNRNFAETIEEKGVATQNSPQPLEATGSGPPSWSFSEGHCLPTTLGSLCYFSLPKGPRGTSDNFLTLLGTLTRDYHCRVALHYSYTR